MIRMIISLLYGSVGMLVELLLILAKRIYDREINGESDEIFIGSDPCKIYSQWAGGIQPQELCRKGIERVY